MSNPRKRTHDERVPTLIYSATGHSRIAKLFTEDSLEQIKENVRKRFGLGSIADFTLLYETDIALVDDDDFAAFEAHAHSSAVPVNVIVNILPNAVVTETVSSTLVADSHVSGPPAKKRRVAAPPPQTESTPPVQKNPAPLAAETVPTATAKEPAPVVGAKRKKKKQGADPPPPTSANVEELPEQERPKKLKKATDKESATASKPAAEVEPDNREQEPPKKRTKKVTPATTSKPSTSAAEGGSTDPEPPEEGGPKVTGKQPATAPKPSTSSAAEGVDDSQPEEPKKKVTGGRRASAVSSSAAGNATGEPQVDGGKPAKSKAKSKKDASDSAPPKSSKKSNVPVSEAAFTFPEELANVISVGGQAAEPESVSVKPRARKTKAAGAEDKAKQRPKKKKADVDPEQPSAAADPAVAAYLKSLIDGIQTDSKPSDDKPSAKASVASAKASVGVDTLSCPVCQTTPFHLQYRCPTVLAGSDSIQKRIAELEDDPADRSELIQQLRKLDPKGSNGVNTSLALDDKRSSISSDDESDSPPLPPISYSVIDAELDAVINGPPSARLAAKDIVSEDEDEEEEQKPENIILENDDDDDIAFRRRSKKLGIREDSSDEEREGIPDAPDSPRSSATQPLVEIDIHQSQVPDFSGDKAVDDAMASDKVLFPTAVNVPEEDRDDASEREQTPRPTVAVAAGDRSPSVIRSHTPTAGQDDPIQPADGFPPTPLGQTKIFQHSSPSTPKVTHKMKDRNGKTPMKLSQLEPPILPGSLRRQSTPVPSTQQDSVDETRAEDKGSRRTRATRSTTRMSSLTAIPPPEVPKRTRAPNKTAEQRAQEQADKAAAKEEKARLKAQAKPAGKGGKKGVKIAEQPPAADVHSSLPTSTPLSTAQWTVLPPVSASPPEEHESMRDELRSSSPETHQDAPLFLPAESQIPFPYSQWTEEAKNSESDDEEEEEVAKAVKSSSQRPSTTSYRRLTDIASQPNVFSSRPTLRSAAFPSSSLPQSKDKRSELYGTLAREEDESDSDSDAGDEPSHIPKSRQAGAQKR